MKKKIIVGNWKMNPGTIDEAKRLFKSIRNIAAKLTKTSVVVCPPFLYISPLTKLKNENVSIGSQNSHYETQGSFTGEISPSMLKDMGVEYTIVGHSERRLIGETDEIISKKANTLLDSGIKTIVCIGEKERNENGSHLDFIKEQIKNSLNLVPRKNINKLIVAYEPIWAIGAKEAMLPEDIYEMSLFIKKILADMYGHDEAVSTPILYGGSVNFRNALDIFTKGKIDGLLVGRESINSPGFTQLLKVADSI